MKEKILWIVVFGAVLLLAELVVRTMQNTSKQVSAAPADLVEVDASLAAEHLGQAIQFKTISHQDRTQLDAEEFLGLHSFLVQTFPNVHAALKREVIANYSLLYTWPGKDPSLKPILLMAHLDVVPIEPGTEGDWSYAPFEGRIAEGFIWGRGAMDDKHGVLAILEAVELLLDQGFQPERTIYLAFGHDEEVGGKEGAAAISALLKSRNVHLEWVLDEGGAIIHDVFPGISEPTAMIGIAEKGKVGLELIVETDGGHSAQPPEQTTIGILSAAINKIESNPFPYQIKEVTRDTLTYLGPEMPPLMHLVMANLWLFAPLVERQLMKSPSSRAMLHTTTAVTIIEGGVKENVIPSIARAVINFRIMPGESIEQVTNRVREIVDDPRVQIAQLWDFGEPSPVSNVEGPGFVLLQNTLSQILPDVIVTPYLVFNATDSRHYTDIADNIYRFRPWEGTSDDLSRIHGTNERISVDNFAYMIQFYALLITQSAQ